LWYLLVYTSLSLTLQQQKVNVVNLFDVSNNFRPGGNEWLIERYMLQQHLQQQKTQQQQQQQHEQQQESVLEQEPSDMYESSTAYTPYTPNTQDIPGSYPMEGAPIME
jgi:transcription initiation factor TFIID subunit TAF12